VVSEKRKEKLPGSVTKKSKDAFTGKSVGSTRIGAEENGGKKKKSRNTEGV